MILKRCANSENHRAARSEGVEKGRASSGFTEPRTAASLLARKLAAVRGSVVLGVGAPFQDHPA